MGVSETARSPRGFFAAWKRYGAYVWNHYDPMFHYYWDDRRDNFVARHMEYFKRNPTLRRFLALVAWAYTPYDSVRTRAILTKLEQDDVRGASSLLTVPRKSRSPSR